MKLDRNEDANVADHNKGTNKTMIATETMIETNNKKEEKARVLIGVFLFSWL